MCQEVQPGKYAGSSSCRACHEKFYQLWSTSHHGLAMQPLTAQFAETALTPQSIGVAVGENSYCADVAAEPPMVRETSPAGDRSYGMAHALGGKNVYYFLTPMERGMLQVLPIAYDVRKKEWFDMAASGVRHFEGVSTQPVNWRERSFTFNTSCYSCHVSQLAVNYDLASDSYRTTWREPGINCETCHGPSEEHVRVCEKAPPGQLPAQLKLISAKSLTKEQRNDLCLSCHSKGQPFTASFTPGERFFDHSGLVTLESRDFYPDGRDLGENYTHTLWRMSACAQSGAIDCMHCHTSSGRYRFAERNTGNNACMPCHEKHVAAPASHTHHKADGEGSKCVACHMPKTAFARMTRSDHSMRPPMPSATIAFHSPNACNLCHTDKNAAWADKLVREWRSRDYQKPVLEAAELIDAARKQQWRTLPEMLAYISREKRDEVFSASLIRLLIPCDNPAKWPALVRALGDRSPLVRAAATEALEGHPTPDSVPALLALTRDRYRLVRVRAAAVLAAIRPADLDEPNRTSLSDASAELETSLASRLDDFASHFNLGNYYSERGELEGAIAAYDTAARLNPGFVEALVNASLAYSRQGKYDKAEEALRKAIAGGPRNAPAYLNLGLLLAETERPEEAVKALRTALTLEPQMAQAAFNLGVIQAQRASPEGLEWCRRAFELRPAEPKYGYTLAFYQLRGGAVDGAVETLEKMLASNVVFPDACAMLGRIYEQRGSVEKAVSVYRHAAEDANLSEKERAAFASRAHALTAR
jgi:tetratricopeptide (TPR) repeat protein